MSYSSFLYEVADGIATVRLNDPETLNALTFETYDGIGTAVQRPGAG